MGTHIPRNKQCILALAWSRAPERMVKMKMGLHRPKPVSAPPSGRRLWLSATPGQQRRCLWPGEGYHRQKTLASCLLLAGIPRRQREGCCTQCSESREGPPQLSSSGAVQGPT